MATAREKLQGSNTKCDHPNCLLGGDIKQDDDVIVVWINRGSFPVAIADIVNLEGKFEIWHTDCYNDLFGEEKEEVQVNAGNKHSE